MNQIQQLLIKHFDIWTAAESEKRSGRGRSSNNGASVYGIKKLRELILELTVRGKLVPQIPNEEPASELLKRLQAERSNLNNENKNKKEKPFPAITENEQPFKLPKGWVWVRNGFLFALRKGKIPKKLSDSNIGLPYLDIDALDRGLIRRYTDDDKCPRSTENDLLVVCDGSRSGLVLQGKNGVVGSTLSIIDTPLIIQPYIKLIFQQGYERLNSTMKGAAIPHLDIKNLALEVTGLPPLSEQLRIIEKVHELMDLCDQLESQHINAVEAHEKLVSHLLDTLTQSKNAEEFNENWQRISVHFDTLFTTESSIDALKQTLLQLAVMGKLVPQLPTDESVCELLKRIKTEKAKLIIDGKIKRDKPLQPISEKEKPFDLPHSWEWIRLGDILDIAGGVTLGRKLAGADLIKLPYLRVANVQRGHLLLDNIKFVEIRQTELLRYQLLADDLLVTEGGDWDKVGRTVVWNSEIEPCLHQNHIFRMRKIVEGVSSDWIEMYMNSIAKVYFQSASKQTTNLASINMTQLKNCLLAVPAFHEQQRILNKVTEFMTLCDHLKTRLADCSLLQLKLADVMIQQAVAQ